MGAILSFLLALAPFTTLLHRDSVPAPQGCLHAAAATANHQSAPSLHAAECAHPRGPHHDGNACSACRSLSQSRNSLLVRTIVGPPTEGAGHLVGDSLRPQALEFHPSNVAARVLLFPHS
jgi:hypothetical protein